MGRGACLLSALHPDERRPARLSGPWFRLGLLAFGSRGVVDRLGYRIGAAHRGLQLGDDGVRHPLFEPDAPRHHHPRPLRSEEHTSELQSLMRISYAVFCLIKKKTTN